MRTDAVANRERLEKGMVQTAAFDLILRYETRLKKGRDDITVLGARQAVFDFAETVGISLRRERFEEGLVSAKELAEKLDLLHRGFKDRITDSLETGDGKAVDFYKGKMIGTEELSDLLMVPLEKV